MSTTIYSWLGIDDRLKTEFTITDNGVDKTYTVLYNKELVVNMSFQGTAAHANDANGVNAQGWTRDKNLYWTEIIDRHPEYFSSNNKFKIQQLGLSPVIDNTFIAYFPEYAQFKGDTLIHYHIGQAGQAVAVPKSIHPGGLSGVHEAEKSLGITANAELASLKCQEALS